MKIRIKRYLSKMFLRWSYHLWPVTPGGGWKECARRRYQREVGIIPS